MAETKNDNIPSWLATQNAQIERATALIKQFGSNVEFVVAKDRTFLTEAITPLTNIDSAIDFIYRQEGKGITSTDVAKFRTDYAQLIESISEVENLAVDLLLKANVRVDNRNLDRKLRNTRTAQTKKVAKAETKKEDKKEDKKAS